VNPPRASTPLRNLALAAASTLVFGGLIEGTARLVEPPPVQKEEYLWDWSERFKDAEFYTLEKGEGYPPSEETNVDGLRDATRPIERRTGSSPFRVAILGDSVAFGHGVEAAEAFPQVLERKLQERHLPWEILNVALPGWSTRQERIAYQRIARKYKPNHVILAVCLNDLAELQINLAKPSGLLPVLFKHSATVRLAMGASRREIGAVEDLFKQPRSAQVENAFRLFFEEVRLLRDEVERDGAKFEVLLFPFRFQLEPNAPPPSVQERILAFASTDKVVVHDFLRQMKEEGASSDLFLDYDHFNEKGHQKVADWIASLHGDLIRMTARLQEGVREPLNRTAEEFTTELKSSNPGIDREFALLLIRQQAAALASPSSEPGVLRDAVVAVAVDDPSPRVRFEAARTIFYLGLPGVASVPALIRGVQHEDPRVRAFATWTLGEMGEIARPALPALVALARLDGGAGKTGALTAIGKIGGDSPETIPLLLEELKHPKENRRYRAARTIGRMGPTAASAVPGLTEALRDPSALVRLHVVRAFGNIGEAARPALPALIEVLNKDPDPEVRKEVSLTLSKLPGR